jgi:putative pyruvate formate lyase activating enzyme
MGRAVGEEEFARICLALEEAGAENINLVTGTHAAGALAAGIRAARTGGLKIPVLWNSSAYERPDVLDRLAPWVDGYLPDLKTLDQDLAERLLRAPDYPRWAASAVLRMMAAGPLLFDRGMLKGGVIIRHLAIPGHLEQSRQVLEWFAEYARGRAFLSLMTQYTPAGPASREPGSAIPKRRISQAEHERLLRWLEEFAIEDGFYQEPADGRDWLPDFRRQNPFSAQPGLTGETRPLALPLWHWREGFLGMPEKGAHTPPVFPPLPREGLIKSSF